MDYRQTHTIAGVNYSILGNCSVLTSGRIAAKLAKEVMPALQAAAAPEGGEQDPIEMLSGMLGSLDTQMVFDCAIELLVHSKVFADDVQISAAEGGKTPRAEFDSHFLKHPQNLFPFLIWIVMQTCGGFFELGKLSQSSTDSQA